MKKTILLFSFFIFISCQSIDNSTHSSVFTRCDEINFYRVTEKSENLIGNNSIETPKPFIDLMFVNGPLKLPNSTEIQELEKYYQNIPLKNDSIIEIAGIFDDAGFPLSKASFSIDIMCAPVYRDILVFKKEGKIIGYAKICLSCYKNYVIADHNRFENFQINYKDLHRLLDSLASS